MDLILRAILFLVGLNLEQLGLFYGEAIRSDQCQRMIHLDAEDQCRPPGRTSEARVFSIAFSLK